ncbi:MAG: hypothetical protein M1269_13435 [Chloroflexi bacterium]|nr:hypothetical protein [Chloroflexota bacterium]
MDVRFNPIKDTANMGYKAVREASRQTEPDSDVDYGRARKIGDSFLKSIEKSPDTTAVYKSVVQSVRKATSKKLYGDSAVKAQLVTLHAIGKGLPGTMSAAIAKVGLGIMNTNPHYKVYEPGGETYEDINTMGQSLMSDIAKNSGDAYSKQVATSAKAVLPGMKDEDAVMFMENAFGKIAKH